MNTSTETLASEPGSNITCLIIRTGRPDCYAHFYPALYQLTLVKDGIEEKIDLGYSGSRLLERLLQEPGDVVSREELMNHAWADRVVGQGSLNQQIYTLRQILGDEKNREIIQTLPRRGYLLNPNYLVEPPSIDDTGTVSETLDTPAAQPAFLQRHSRQRTSWLILLSIFSIIGLTLFAALYHISQPKDLLSSEMNLGSLHVHYIDHDSQRLQQLILQTHGLTSRLAVLASKPATLVLRLHSGFYELLCLQPNGGARSLMMHESQLDQVADTQLSRCLP
ncbi:transcriptional regulator CadC [Ectopseudomonas mendocina]|jgi:DNA-binding winged helix-turn-helix (wHTH) protein|uniref:Transcriptional regulator CadC n=2 Tax=Ectopseudomonas mendocina TaxID=300 RepID=A0A379IMQ7_ECTME|nr:winged helix-turn-helix domain-containing protein [Pseudomonas mendocina]AEB56240.1 transcriptional regulator, CadC [Pseudomonas mendocina NK-01]ALN21334.1 CadC family transcriptional regulator [Pseudomonas mendocina S5.2]KES02350.1 CadC family transcriptional regulator [Pseudomonas mendocina]MDF2077406.1 winged helix-turn-helix domain-containing protein [Pseudomonas mendocina]QTN48103.1 winged helix-turn-helix domain-containing protein [Pseudomonas mendocina]